ncbi:MAG: hypothetical protein AB7G06_00905 [Bdellovibrionales bacterium]
MPLNLYNGGAAVPHIRYMAGTSSWALSTEQGTKSFKLPRCVFDLANIRTGWGIFAENSPPEWVWDPNLQTPAVKPQDGREWKRGFGFNILLPQEFGPDRLREFATTATGASEGLKKLYALYEEQLPNHRGQVPVVEFIDATNIQIGKGRTNVPNFVIVDWIDRPAALDDGESKAPNTAPQPQQSYQPAASIVQPPQPSSAPDTGNLSKPVF